MGTKVRRRIRQAFKAIDETGSHVPDSDQEIGKLPKKPVKPRPLHPIEAKLKQHGAAIIKVLHQKGGFVPLGDHSPPKAIWDEFTISKRVFKRAVGHLLKEGRIEILPKEGIRLTEKGKPTRPKRSNRKSSAVGIINHRAPIKKTFPKR